MKEIKKGQRVIVTEEAKKAGLIDEIDAAIVSLLGKYSHEVTRVDGDNVYLDCLGMENTPFNKSIFKVVGIDGVSITKHYAGLKPYEIIVDKKAYNVSISHSQQEVKKPCSLCGEKKNVQAPGLDNLYYQAEESLSIPVDLTEKGSVDLAKKIIRKVRKQLIEFDPPICALCLAKSDDAEGVRGELIDSVVE